MLTAAVAEEKTTATALPIIDGTYRIRPVQTDCLLTHLTALIEGFPDLVKTFPGGVAIGCFTDPKKEQELIPRFACDWIIERYAGSQPEAGMPGFQGAAREPWYRIWNKDTGKILVTGNSGNPGGGVGLWGEREEFMGEKTMGHLEEMWRIIKFDGKRLRTGAHADDNATWFMIQNVASGQLLVWTSKVYVKIPFGGSDWEDKLPADQVLTAGNEKECYASNDPRKMWMLEFIEPAELLDFRLHTAVAPQKGEEVLTTETSEYCNESDVQQEHTFTFNYEYSDSYRYTWEKSLSIGIEVEVSADFPGCSASTKTSTEKTFKVGEEQTNTFTYSKVYGFPVKVPPHSKVQAAMIVYKGSYDVGFTAKLRIGSQILEENGTLRAQLGAGVTHFNVKQINLYVPVDVPNRKDGGRKEKEETRKKERQN